MERLEKLMTQVKFMKPPFKLDNINEEQVRELLLHSYKKTVFKNSCEFEDSDELQHYILSVSKWLIKTDLKKSLILYGKNDSSKTTMAKSIHFLLKLINNTYSTYESDQPFTIQYITAQKMEDICRNSSSDFKQIIKNDILFIDDIGRESVRMYGSYEILGRVISERYDNNLSTILTTNYSLQKIKKCYGASFYGQIIERFEMIGSPYFGHREKNIRPDHDKHITINKYC